MKKVITGAVLTVLGLSLPAMAAVTNKYQFKDKNAYASFYTYDGCSSTGVNVSAYNNIVKDGPGAPTSQIVAYLDYYNYNYCTGTYSSGSGSSPNVNFTVDNALKSASLNGTIAVYDYSSGTTKTADVALTWTATENYSSSSKSSYTYQTPTTISRYRSKGDSSDAQVSGSVMLDGVNIIANQSSSYGSLNSSKSGTLERTTR